jgi:hypothetical protein
LGSRSSFPNRKFRFEFICLACGYGAVAAAAPARCPLCGSTVWQHSGRPLDPARLDASHSVGPRFAQAPAAAAGLASAANRDAEAKPQSPHHEGDCEAIIDEERVS